MFGLWRVNVLFDFLAKVNPNRSYSFVIIDECIPIDFVKAVEAVPIVVRIFKASRFMLFAEAFFEILLFAKVAKV
jgi:hypothetical protein